MITQITAANQAQYKSLFESALQDLIKHKIVPTNILQEVEITEAEYVAGRFFIKENDTYRLTTEDELFNPDAIYAEGTITSLSEYFSYIEELTGINKKYTILPLDENFLEVNANTRTITIPQHFATHGISVNGDVIAEVVYFVIDRFYDMDDLFNKDICIQWKGPDGEERISYPWVIDITTKPGKIVIGWAITKEITDVPGKVEFSLRFYRKDDNNELNYSFSTLTASAEIKTTLNYNISDLENNAIDPSDVITNRMENSEIQDGDTPDPIAPIINAFSINGAKYDLIEATEEGEENYYKIYLTDVATGEPIAGANYTVQAITEDAGSLTYSWIKRDVDGDILGASSYNSYIDFVPTTDIEKNKFKVYYVEDKKTPGAYVPHSFVEGEEFPPLDTTLYEKVAKIDFVASTEEGIVLGSYQPKIINRVGHKRKNTLGGLVVVEGPTEPEFIQNLQAGTDGSIFESTEGDTVNLSVVANTDPNSYVTYEWAKSKNGEEYELIENTTNSYVVEGKSYGNGDDGSGFYKVTVSSLLNGEIKTLESNEIRVSHTASDFTFETSAPTLGEDYNINEPLQILNIVANEYEAEYRTSEDSFTYQWYKYIMGTGDDYLTDLEAAANGTYIANDTKIEGATASELNIENTVSPVEGGFYFCIITNNYNGTTYSKSSKFFNVIDIAPQSDETV